MATISIMINGERKDVPAECSVGELLRRLVIEPERVAVERNRKVLRRAHFASTFLNHGDELEIVTFVGGG